MSRMIFAIAQAFGLDEGTVRETIRQLRTAGKIPGANMAGHTAPEATVGDLATVVLALLSGDQPTKAPRDLERSEGLVAAQMAGGGKLLVAAREVGETLLLDMIGLCIGDLAEAGGIPDVRDLTIQVSRPWPGAIVVIGHEDGTSSQIVFHHRRARATGKPERDKRQLKVLRQEWRFKPGSTKWTKLDFAGLKLIADVYAGRVAEDDLRPGPAEPMPMEGQLWS